MFSNMYALMLIHCQFDRNHFDQFSFTLSCYFGVLTIVPCSNRFSVTERKPDNKAGKKRLSSR